MPVLEGEVILAERRSVVKVSQGACTCLVMELHKTPWGCTCYARGRLYRTKWGT